MPSWLKSIYLFLKIAHSASVCFPPSCLFLAITAVWHCILTRAGHVFAVSYLLQDTDGVPAALEAGCEAGRRWGVVVLRRLREKFRHRYLIRHPTAWRSPNKRWKCFFRERKSIHWEQTSDALCACVRACVRAVEMPHAQQTNVTELSENTQTKDFASKKTFFYVYIKWRSVALLSERFSRYKLRTRLF